MHKAIELTVQLPNGQTWRATMMSENAARRATEKIRAMCPDAVITMQLYLRPPEFHTGFAAAVDFNVWMKDNAHVAGPLGQD